MDKEQIMLVLRTQGNRSAVFADLQLTAKEACQKCHREEEQITRSGVLTIVLSAASFMGAMSVGSIMAPITLVAVGAAAAWAIGEHVTKAMPIADRAAELDKLLSDATPDEWATLAELCGTPEDFMDCLRAGFVAGNMRSSVKGTQYHSALTHAHGLGKVLPEGFEQPQKTGFGAPKQPRSWRDAPIDEPESDPTNAEIALILKLCNERVGVRAVADRILALRDTNRQAALNLAIVHAGISDRDYVKGGVPLNRLRKIKAWAADGDKVVLALLPATPVIPEVEPIEPEVVAVKPSIVHVAAPVAAPISEEEFEEYDNISPPPLPANIHNQTVEPSIAAAPKFFRAGAIRQNTGLSTAKDLIEACMKEAYRSTTMIGGERSGKTFLASVFSKCLKAERNTTITYINLFDANGDSANDWGHSDHVITANLNDDRCDVEVVLRAVFARLRVFQKETNTHLYFDEWVAFTSRSNAWEKKAAEDIRRANSMSAQGEYLEPEGVGTSAVELMNLMSAIGSELSNIGKKQLKAMWLISPALRASDIYEQGKIMKSLAPGIVVIPPGRTIEWTHPTGVVQEIGFDLARYQVSEVNLAIPKSQNIPTDLDCDRAVFIGGTWYSLDGLVNELPSEEAPAIPNTVQPIALVTDLQAEDLWAEDEIIEEAIVESIEIGSMEQIAGQIMAMQELPLATRLQMIKQEAANRA